MDSQETEPNEEGLSLLDDQPIRSVGADAFGRKEFVERLAKLLDRPPLAPSLVVSLEEDFGFGKTSTLNFVKERLAASSIHNPVVIDFNPWIISGSSNIIESFLFQVGASLASKESKGDTLKTIGKKLSAYSSVFSTLKLVPGAEPWATIAQTVFEHVGDSASKLSDLQLEDYSVEKHRVEIQNAIKASERPIIVVIDDLDRLTPAEVCRMIQVVKVVSDFDGITYLLAFEHGYLEHALGTLGIKRPDAYLEKIIQFRVSLPEIRTAKLEGLFLDELKSLEKKQQIPLESDSAGRIQSAIFGSGSSLLRNLRDVKRLINNLQFLGEVALQHIQLWDLVALEVIRLRAPEFWKFIKEHQIEITVDGIEEPLMSRVSGHFKQDAAKAQREEALKHKVGELVKSLGAEGERIANLSNVLFSRHAQIFDLSANIKPASGRVCFVENLASYFCFGVGLGGLENKRYFEFLQKDSERDRILKTITDSDLASSFINTLEDVVSDAPMVNVKDGLSKLGNLVISHAPERDQFAFYQSGLFGIFCRFIQEMFTYHLVEKDDMDRLLADTACLPVKVALCRAVSGENPLIRTDQFKEDNRNMLKSMITPDVVERVFEEVREYIDKHPLQRQRWVMEMFRLFHGKEPTLVEKLIHGLIEKGEFLTALWLVSTWGSIGGRPIVRVSDVEMGRFGGRAIFAKAEPTNFESDVSDSDKARLHSYRNNEDCYVDTLEKPEMSLWSTTQPEESQ